MSFNDWFWLIVAIYFSAIFVVFVLGCKCGREKAEHDAKVRAWERAPESEPYRADVDETWARLLAAWGDDGTGIVDLPPVPVDTVDTFSGLIDPPIPHRHKRLADTGELRNLAFAGDLDAILNEVAAYTTELNKKEISE